MHEIEVFGRPHVRLYATTSAKHADFTAKLVRVTLNGRAEFLSIGIARSAHLFGDAGCAADEVKAWEFALEPVAFVLAQGSGCGSKLRVLHFHSTTVILRPM